jgi:hypothetical protein
MILQVILAGCGTTKWSDTSRTATEQLLLTSAMDKAVEKIDFQALAGKKVSINSTALDHVSDSKYLVSEIRQHLLASGVLVCPEDKAEYILELRAGVVGTDRNDLFYGIPSFSFPTGLLGDQPAGTTTIPEVAFIKKTDQKAVIKVAMFAYNKEANNALWQSGSISEQSRIRAWWFFGFGPCLRGDIYNGTEIAGTKIPEFNLPIIVDRQSADNDVPELSVSQPAFFVESPEISQETPPSPKADRPSGNANPEDTAAPLAGSPVTCTTPGTPPYVSFPHDLSYGLTPSGNP